MKRLTNEQLNKEIKRLLDAGQIVIGEIRVNDGENVASHTTLSACPPEYREGYRLALETHRKVYFRDVVYDPVFLATENATSIATLK